MDKAKDMEKTKVTAVAVTYNRKALLEKPFNYFIKRYFLWPLGIKMHNLEPTEEWKESSHG